MLINTYVYNVYWMSPIANDEISYRYIILSFTLWSTKSIVPHGMEALSELLAICEGNSPNTGHKGIIDGSFPVRMKVCWTYSCRWFETPWRPYDITAMKMAVSHIFVTFPFRAREDILPNWHQVMPEVVEIRLLSTGLGLSLHGRVKHQNSTI